VFHKVNDIFISRIKTCYFITYDSLLVLFLYVRLFYALQIVAAPSQDRLCLAVAEALEKDLGGWIPPTAESSGKYNYVNETK
jgi:hypothetical protein